MLACGRHILSGAAVDLDEMAVFKCIEQAWKMEQNALPAKMEEIIMKYDHYEY